jgi:hypothetical protein
MDDMRESWEAKHPGNRIDMDLPLGFRINALVEIPQVDFILAGDQLKIKHPGLSNSVSAMGKFPMGQYMWYRFYLPTTEKLYMLQVIMGENKRVGDCKLFMPYDEVYPENSDEWDFWLSPNDGYIGYSEFKLKDETSYAREWQGGTEQVLEDDGRGNRITRIQPYEMLETVYFDPYGKESDTVRHTSMMYSRWINHDLQEYLLVSADEDKDGAAIEIMTGVKLEPATIKVI